MLAGANVTGKTERHGKSEEALKSLRDRLASEKEKLKTINRNGTRAQKRAQRTLIRNLQRKIDKLKKGVEHHRGVNSKTRSTYPWMMFDFQFRQMLRRLDLEPPPDTAMHRGESASG